MKRLVAVAIVVALAACVNFARAEGKADATGTWTWVAVGTSSNQEIAVKLKREGDKLTGVYSRSGKDTQIEDGKISGDEVSFTVTPARNGKKYPMKYSGKIIGDTITGTMEIELDGAARTTPWKATRSK